MSLIQLVSGNETWDNHTRHFWVALVPKDGGKPPFISQAAKQPNVTGVRQIRNNGIPARPDLPQVGGNYGMWFHGVFEIEDMTLLQITAGGSDGRMTRKRSVKIPVLVRAQAALSRLSISIGKDGTQIAHVYGNFDIPSKEQITRMGYRGSMNGLFDDPSHRDWGSVILDQERPALVALERILIPESHAKAIDEVKIDKTEVLVRPSRRRIQL